MTPVGRKMYFGLKAFYQEMKIGMLFICPYMNLQSLPRGILYS